MKNTFKEQVRMALNAIHGFLENSLLKDASLISEYPSEANGQKRILLVDDDPIALEVLGRLLENDGAEVLKVESVEMAISSVKDFAPDLIITDMHFNAESSGLSLLYRLSKLDGVSRIPVIVISGSGDLPIVHQALSLGARDYLCKPVDPTNFSQRIKIRLHECD